MISNQQLSRQAAGIRHSDKNDACKSDLLHVIAQITDNLPAAEKQAVFLTMFKGLTHCDHARRK